MPRVELWPQSGRSFKPCIMSFVRNREQCFIKWSFERTSANTFNSSAAQDRRVASLLGVWLRCWCSAPCRLWHEFVHCYLFRVIGCLLFAKETVGSLTSTNQCQQTGRLVQRPSEGRAHTLMNHPDCETPGWQFIAGSGLESRLHRLEASVRTFKVEAILPALQIKIWYLAKTFFGQICCSVAFVCRSVCLSVCLSREFWPQFSSNRSDIYCLCTWLAKGEQRLILVKIRIRIWEFLSDFSTLRDRAKNDILHNISKGYGWIRTKLGVRVGSVTRTSRFGFGEAPDSDRPISGIQNVNYSAWRRYALYRGPFRFTKCHSLSDFFIYLFVCNLWLLDCIIFWGCSCATDAVPQYQ